MVLHTLLADNHRTDWAGVVGLADILHTVQAEEAVGLRTVQEEAGADLAANRLDGVLRAGVRLAGIRPDHHCKIAAVAEVAGSLHSYLVERCCIRSGSCCCCELPEAESADSLILHPGLARTTAGTLRLGH